MNGSFVYTPASGYTGPDSFTYFANDGTANSAAAALVSLTVTSTASGPPNDAFANAQCWPAIGDCVGTNYTRHQRTRRT